MSRKVQHQKTDRPKAYSAREAVFAAWREQLAIAAHQPLVGEILAVCSGEVWPRFARFYETLQALPRRKRRALQRRLGQTLAAVALMLALGNESAMAATIEVDEVGCTLAAAITAANTDTASAGCVAGNGADTLTLRPNSTHTLTRIDNNTFGPTGLPVVASEILIEGNGATIERKQGSAPEFRILAVNESGKLTLKQARVSGGSIDSKDNMGGGLYSRGGDIALEHSVISGNNGDGIHVTGYDGIRNAGNTTATIANCTISDNTGSGVVFIGFEDDHREPGGYATISGSTIVGNSIDGVTLFGRAFNNMETTIANSTISGNSRDGVHFWSEVCEYCEGSGTRIVDSTISGNLGTGISSYTGTIDIVNSSISANSNGGVRNGTGVNEYWVGICETHITNSTISGNSTAGHGGGVAVVESRTWDGYDLTITNSTISGNSSEHTGGGVFIGETADFRIVNSTISGNRAKRKGGGIRLAAEDDGFISGAFERSIIAGNVAPTRPEILDATRAGARSRLTVDKFNLFGVDGVAGIGGAFTPGPTDIVPLPRVLIGDILDPVLADNGGPTLTHALIAGSPAIDAIASSTQPDCDGADQRGVPRPQDGNADGVSACDIGAYERAAGAVPFARFDIASAKVKQARRAGRDRFNVAGRLRLDAEGDGLDVLNQEVVVTFDSFSETIPPGSFRSVRRGDDRDESSRRAFIYRSSSAGIRRLILSVDGARGQFSIVARQLDLDELELPAQVGVSLRIGTDVGQTTVALNRKGSLIGGNGEGENQGN